MPGGRTLFGVRAFDAFGQGGGGNPGGVAPLAPGSAQFDGNSSLSLTPGFSVPAGQALSFSFWMKHTAGAGTYPNIITQTANPSAPANNMFWMGFYNLTAAIRPVAYAADTSNASPGGSDVAQNTWRFYVVCYEDSVLNAPTIRARIDGGAFSAPSGGMDQPMHNNPAACSLLIGNGFGDGFGQAPAGGMIGDIDSLFFWTRDLTNADADALWNAGAGIDASGLTGALATNLLAAYNLDGPVGGVWPDSSGNGHHLAVNGNVTVGPPRNT